MRSARRADAKNLSDYRSSCSGDDVDLICRRERSRRCVRLTCTTLYRVFQNDSSDFSQL